MRNIIKSSIILALVTFISAMVLSQVKKITYPSILKQMKAKQDRALSLVLPGYSLGKKVTIKIDGVNFTYWPAEKTVDNKPVTGYAFITEKPGYGGEVRSMAGVDEAGNILGISILQQSETPGLGARSVEIATSETFFGKLFGKGGKKKEESHIPWFQEQYTGLDLNKKIEIVKRGDWKPAMREDLLEKNAISAMTGATVTSTAVTRSLEEGYARLKKAISMTAQKEEEK